MRKYRTGIRAGLPLFPPVLLVGISFGVVAEPVMGPVAPIVMSAIVHAGSSQFAALSALSAGAAAPAAILAGILMNLRFLAMGFAVAPSLRGGRWKRVLKGQAVVDASWALANRGGGRFDPHVVVGATLPQAAGWIGGTALGVFLGGAVGDPEALGLDALFPAFFLALLVPELRDRRAVVVAALAVAITLVLVPIVPPGIPVLAAAAAALLGLTPGAVRAATADAARTDAVPAEAP